MNMINHRCVSVIIIPPPGPLLLFEERLPWGFDLHLWSSNGWDRNQFSWPFPFQVVLDLDHVLGLHFHPVLFFQFQLSIFQLQYFFWRPPMQWNLKNGLTFEIKTTISKDFMMLWYVSLVQYENLNFMIGLRKYTGGKKLCNGHHFLK